MFKVFIAASVAVEELGRKWNVQQLEVKEIMMH